MAKEEGRRYDRGMFENLDPSAIEDATVRVIVLALMNEVERLSVENKALKEEVQRLRDDNRRLQGEQGKPVIRPMTRPPSMSSEQERHVPRPHRKGAKQRHVCSDREEIRRVDRQDLPADAEFKGYVDVVVQDVSFATDNVLFHKEKFYSPSERKTYIATLPAGYMGAVGTRSCRVDYVVVSRIGHERTEDQGPVADGGAQHQRGGDLQHADQTPGGVPSGTTGHPPCRSGEHDVAASGQHGDTAARGRTITAMCCAIRSIPRIVRCHRRTGSDLIICALLGRQTPSFVLNDMAVQMLHTIGVPQKWIRAVIARVPWAQEMTAERVRALLEMAAPPLPWYIAKMVYDGLALGFYRTQTAVLVPTVLLTDDAAQSTLLAEEWALCWVHEARHYKKLEPRLDYHCPCLATFTAAFWTFYRRLLAYRAQPTAADATALASAFDTLFGTPTGYDQLDHRAALTRARKEHLLMVLKHPEIPLHNNPAELGVRQRVRKRDVRLAACTPEGLAAWDTFQTIVETAKKLGVNLTAYLRDRITHHYALPSLASLIAHQSLRAVHPRAA